MCSWSQYWGNMFNISISNLSNVKKGTLSSLMEDTKLEEAAQMLEGIFLYLSLMSSYLEYSVWFGTLLYNANWKESSGGQMRG